MSPYKYDEDFCFIAAKCFTDIHHGNAITEEELELRNELEQEYADAIEMAKGIIAENPEFENMSYEEQINYCCDLLIELQKQVKLNSKAKQ